MVAALRCVAVFPRPSERRSGWVVGVQRGNTLIQKLEILRARVHQPTAKAAVKRSCPLMLLPGSAAVI
jgi:hypothetical protein